MIYNYLCVFISNWIFCVAPIIIVSHSPSWSLILESPLRPDFELKSERIISPPVLLWLTCTAHPWCFPGRGWGVHQSSSRRQTTHSWEYGYTNSHFDGANSNIHLPSWSLTLRRNGFREVKISIVHSHGDFFLHIKKSYFQQFIITLSSGCSSNINAVAFSVNCATQ